MIIHTANVAGELPEGRRIVLRNDSVSAVQVINSGKAYSEPMLQALRVLRDVQAKLGVNVVAQHISGDKNTILDPLSRGRGDQ